MADVNGPSLPKRKHIRNGEEMLDSLAADLLVLDHWTAEQTEEFLSALEEGSQSVNLTDSVVHELTSTDTSTSTGPCDRFTNVIDDETAEFVLKARNKNTINKTKSDLKIINEYLRSIGELRPIHELNTAELDSVLARFILCVRKTNGEEYEPDTAIQGSVDRHLRDMRVNFSIKRDAEFSHSRRVLESKRKFLKAEGKGNHTNKAEPLTKEEMGILREKEIVGIGNPQALLNAVWINNGIFFGLRGRQDHQNMKWGDIVLKKTSDGTEYLEFNERSTKTRSGASSKDYRPVTPKVFAQPESALCPIRVYKEYKRHRPADCLNDEEKFYLRPLINPKDIVWYSHQCLGKDKLGKMMQVMAEKGDLKGRKVNHSTRKTFATTLVQGGVPHNEVAQLGGWKSVQTLTHYAVPSLDQQKEVSHSLANVVLGCDEKENNSITTGTSCNASDVQNNLVPIINLPVTCTDQQPFNQPLVKDLDICIPHNNVVNSSSSSSVNSSKQNPFAILCGASINGGTININIQSMKRKNTYSSSESSQEM